MQQLLAFLTNAARFLRGQLQTSPRYLMTRRTTKICNNVSALVLVMIDELLR